MKNSHRVLVLSIFVTLSSSLSALEFSGKVSFGVNLLRADLGDLSYVPIQENQSTINSNEQSLRLMLDSSVEQSKSSYGFSLHGKVYRENINELSGFSAHSSDLFRYQALSSREDLNTFGNKKELYIYDLDIANAFYHFGDAEFILGRQAIDWGVGRFWQPFNVFGAFAPTDLNTDYKAGIDSARLIYYPSEFSSLDLTYVSAPNDSQFYDHNFASRYKYYFDDFGDVSFLLADVLNNTILGVSFDSEWKGMGWRMEGANYTLENDDKANFFIAGIDYNFDNGAFIVLEYYQNELGAGNALDIPASIASNLLIYGLQAHLSERVLGFSVNKDITPLSNLAYVVLLSPLDDFEGNERVSNLHQLSYTYSLSNNSDLLFSYLKANGSGLSVLGLPQSEFGHVPKSFSARARFYF